MNQFQVFCETPETRPCVLAQESILKNHHGEVTHLHVVPVTEDLPGSPLGVGAGLGHIVGNKVWLTVQFQFQADVKHLIILQTEHLVSKLHH